MSLRRNAWVWLCAVLALTLGGGQTAAEKMATFDAGDFRLPAFAAAPDTGMMMWVNIDRLGPAELTQSFTAVRNALPASTQQQLDGSAKQFLAGMMVYSQAHTRAKQAGARGLVVGIRALNPATMAYQPPAYAMLHTSPDATLEGLAAASKFTADASFEDAFDDAYRLCPGWFALGTAELAEPPVRHASEPHARLYAGVLKRETEAAAVVVMRPNTLFAPFADLIPMLAQDEPELLKSWEQFQQMKGVVLTVQLGQQPEMTMACHFKTEAAAQTAMAEFTADGMSELIAEAGKAGVALDPARVDAAMATIQPARNGKTVTYRFGLDAVAAWAPIFIEAAPAITADAPTQTRNPFSR
ncbi:MAG: hypothetical protein AAGH92_09740 [Planctomycetota bacterium]